MLARSRIPIPLSCHVPSGTHDTASLVLCANSRIQFHDGAAANGLRIGHLTSSSLMSGYTYGGIVAGQPPSNDNIHASEYEFTTPERNLAIEVLNFNSEGSIKQVTYTTTDGVLRSAISTRCVPVEAETTNAQERRCHVEQCTCGVPQAPNWQKVTLAQSLPAGGNLRRLPCGHGRSVPQ